MVLQLWGKRATRKSASDGISLALQGIRHTPGWSTREDVDWPIPRFNPPSRYPAGAGLSPAAWPSSLFGLKCLFPFPDISIDPYIRHFYRLKVIPGWGGYNPSSSSTCTFQSYRILWCLDSLEKGKKRPLRDIRATGRSLPTMPSSRTYSIQQASEKIAPPMHDDSSKTDITEGGGEVFQQAEYRALGW